MSSCALSNDSERNRLISLLDYTCSKLGNVLYKGIIIGFSMGLKVRGNVFPI